MLKISKEQKDMALSLGRKHKAKVMWVNKKGEYFTQEQFAKASVGGNDDELAKVEITAEVQEKKTNDLDTAKAVIAEIEAAQTQEVVEDILTAEKEGKNRETVIKAAEKKLETFKTED